jgi:hypothetical protein
MVAIGINMYEMIPWSSALDLAGFYKKAQEKGYENNKDQKSLIDCFANERHKQIWLLYYNKQPVGSVAAHSLDLPELEEDAFRICARTCVLTDLLPRHSLRTITGITNHQNYTAQFFIPQCIEWAGRDKKLYITSNNLKSGSQRLVHKIFCPLLEAEGVLTRTAVIEYRGVEQTFWLLHVDRFYQKLNKFPRW